MKKKIILAIAFLPILLNAQVQIGNNIEAEDIIQPTIGSSISDDGNRICLYWYESDDNQFIKVYELFNNTWIQLGGNIEIAGFFSINGEINISLSDNGNRVAIVAENSTGTTNIQVFEYDSNLMFWKELSLNFPDSEIIKVKLSPSGELISVLWIDDNDEKYYFGLFNYVDSDWVPFSNLVVDSINSIKDYSINSAFDQVVFSDDFNNKDNPSFNKSRIRTFNLFNGIWLQSIDDLIENDIAGAFLLGIPVAVNDSGNKLLSGNLSEGYCKTYLLEDNSWVEADSIQITSSPESLSTRFHLSRDGNYLMGTNGIFNWQNSSWQPIFDNQETVDLLDFNLTSPKFSLQENGIRAVFDNYYIETPFLLEYVKVLEFETNTTSTELVKRHDSLTFFPNPNTEGVFYTHFEFDKYIVYDSMGNKVIVGQYNGHIDLSLAARGIYYIQCIKDGTTFNSKLVIL